MTPNEPKTHESHSYTEDKMWTKEVRHKELYRGGHQRRQSHSEKLNEYQGAQKWLNVTHKELVLTEKAHTVNHAHSADDLPFLPFTGAPWGFSSHSAANKETDGGSWNDEAVIPTVCCINMATQLHWHTHWSTQTKQPKELMNKTFNTKCFASAVDYTEQDVVKYTRELFGAIVISYAMAFRTQWL